MSVLENERNYLLKGGVVMLQDWGELRVSVVFTVTEHQRCLKLGTQLSLSVWLPFTACQAAGSPADVNRLIFKK